jgi:hypothetical protein
VYVPKHTTMASTTETGHAKNIANLKLLNEINAGFGAAYNPSNKLYTLANMQSLYSNCNKLQGDLNTQKGIFEPAQNARVTEFSDAQKLARRIRTAAKTCGAGKGFYIDVNKIVTKLIGERAGKPKATAEDPSGISVSQQSYDNIVNNYDALAKMLAGETNYAPNEADLSVAAVTAKQAALDSANNAVKRSAVPYNNAVIARNKALYTEETGLCDVALGSKDYVKQVFTYGSPEFKSISKIAFRKLPKGK